MEKPSQRYLRGLDGITRCNLGEDLRERLVGFEQFAAGDGVPGKECDVAGIAPGEGVFVTAVSQRIAILHADDGDDFLSCFDFGGDYFAEADVADLALFLHTAEGAEALFEWRPRVDAVQLVKFDAVQFQAPQAHFYALN